MSDDEPISAPAVFGAMSFVSAPGVAHVAVAGELCAATVVEFERALAAVDPEALVVVLDLSAVTVLDEPARRAVLAARRRLRRERRRMLVIATESIRRGLEGGSEKPTGGRATRQRANGVGPRTRGEHLALAEGTYSRRRRRGH